MFKRWGHHWLTVLSVGLLAACGGGGGSEEVALPPATAPTITSQPSDVQVVAGGEARFLASAQGTAVTWTWQRSNDNGTTWVTVANAGTASPDNSTAFLALSAVALSDNNARFRAVASSSGLQTLSSAATLTVSAQVSPPSISVQLVPQQAVAGSTVTLAITAVGTDLRYQWQSSRDGATWADVPAATAPTLLLANLGVDANGTQYRVVVRNTAASVTSNAVVLTVTAAAAAPAFTLQPLAASVTAPGTATFVVAVSGQPAPTLQWQRSSNGGTSYADLPGATAASYTTPATTLADSGALYRAVASSSAGTATSVAAGLTVAAAPSLPVITTQPQDTSVAVAQTATWTAVASGVPTPAYQWQLSTDGGTTFANINGATGASHSVVAAATDNGRRYRVVASNSQGTAVSRAALLTVTAPASVLSGRAWLQGQRLNAITTDILIDQSGAAPVAVIDKVGRVHVLYAALKSSPAQWEIRVVTSLPGAPGAQPVYGASVLLGSSTTSLPLPEGLWLNAGGNATATWREVVPCAQDPAENCVRTSHSRYDAATGTWLAAAVASERELAVLKGTFNEVGDQVALVQNINSANLLTGFNLGWRQAGRNDIETLALGTGDLIADLFTLSAKVALDNNGAITVVYVRVGADGAANLVSRRGSIRTATLGPEELLESRSAPATLNGFWFNAAGQVVVLWYQNDGTRVTQYASTLDSSNGSWTRTELGPWSSTDVFATGTVTPGGDFHAYSMTTCRALRRVGGIWLTPAALPTDLCASTSQRAMDSHGNWLFVNRLDGRWATFDAARQALVSGFVPTVPSTGAGYMLGTRFSGLPGTLLLSDVGIGAYVSTNSFDVLPSASAPSGDSRGTGFKNVWNLYFK